MRMETEAAWEKRFTDMGAFWFHDGNPKRPYARLTSGKISNGFFNGGKVCGRPRVLAEAVETLCKAPRFLFDHLGEKVLLELDNIRGPNTYVVGPAMGGITFAHEVAEYLDANMVFVEKNDADEFELKRFDAPPPGSVILLAEDTVSTGGSVLKVHKLMQTVSPESRISNYVLALLNRSESEFIGDFLHVIPLMRKKILSWDEGKNPFTTDGKELTAPLRPKSPVSNWNLLTKDY